MALAGVPHTSRRPGSAAATLLSRALAVCLHLLEFPTAGSALVPALVQLLGTCVRCDQVCACLAMRAACWSVSYTCMRAYSAREVPIRAVPCSSIIPPCTGSPSFTPGTNPYSPQMHVPAPSELYAPCLLCAHATFAWCLAHIVHKDRSQHMVAAGTMAGRAHSLCDTQKDPAYEGHQGTLTAQHAKGPGI